MPRCTFILNCKGSCRSADYTNNHILSHEGHKSLWRTEDVPSVNMLILQKWKLFFLFFFLSSMRACSSRNRPIGGCRPRKCRESIKHCTSLMHCFLESIREWFIYRMQTCSSLVASKIAYFDIPITGHWSRAYYTCGMNDACMHAACMRTSEITGGTNLFTTNQQISNDEFN